MKDQISIKEFTDPFTGEPVKKCTESQPPLRGPPEKLMRSANLFMSLEARLA